MVRAMGKDSHPFKPSTALATTPSLLLYPGLVAALHEKENRLCRNTAEPMDKGKWSCICVSQVGAILRDWILDCCHQQMFLFHFDQSA